MSRDELNKALNEERMVRFGKSRYKIMRVYRDNYLGDLVSYRKVKKGLLGRLRVMDLITFTKLHEVL